MSPVGKVPSYPTTFSVTEMVPAEDAATTAAELEADRAAREDAYSVGRAAQSACQDALTAMHYGLKEAAAAKLGEAESALKAREEARPHVVGCREGNLNQVSESYLRAKAFAHFLETGQVLSRAAAGSDFDDEEYLSGVIGACQELAHYSLRRATALDIDSVRMCRDFIADVKTELLGFDFRNGPLRRKFDGVKYAQRRCEDMLYELSFSAGADAAAVEPPAKRARTGDEGEAEGDAESTSVLDKVEWATLRDNYANYDKKREMVIKDCRDVQKAAKQAIFAAHRRDLNKSDRLIADAISGSRRIYDTYIEGSPSLRYGSFSNALEELAEAELFAYWLKAVAAGSSDLVMHRSDIAGGLLTANEYLGAVSDWSGEVGRIGVEAATKREHTLVRACLEAAFAAHAMLASIGLTGKAAKKVDAAERNLRKLETIEYDLAVRANQKGPTLNDVDPGANGKDDAED